MITVPPVRLKNSMGEASTSTPSQWIKATTLSPQLRRRPILFRHLLVLVVLSCLLSISSASLYIGEEMVDSRDNSPEVLGSTIAMLAELGPILVDQRPPPDPNARTQPKENDLRRRAAAEPTTTSRTSAKSTSHITASTTTKSTDAAATEAPIALPSPLDNGLGSNVTKSCSTYINGFLSNSTFKACLPFSLLLLNSNSFFQDSKSFVRMTQVLDFTCAVNFASCTKVMASLASNLTTTANCASDISSQSPLVEQVQMGLQAYGSLFKASCLRNPSTSSYCFADAITNASSPTDGYIYYLPLGIALPGGSQPTCDACLQNTMAVFQAASSDRSSAISGDYTNAAMQVNVQCGPTFVNASLASAVVSSGGVQGSTPTIAYLAFAVLLSSLCL